MGWKKLFANHVSDKGLIYRIYKNSLTLNNNNSKSCKYLIRKWTDDLNRHFFQEDRQMAMKYFEEVLNITRPQEKADHDHSEIPLHAC